MIEDGLPLDCSYKLVSEIPLEGQSKWCVYWIGAKTEWSVEFFNSLVESILCRGL